MTLLLLLALLLEIGLRRKLRPLFFSSCETFPCERNFLGDSFEFSNSLE